MNRQNPDGKSPTATALLHTPVALPQALVTRVQDFIRASKAENTVRGYQTDWRDFCDWCQGQGRGALPATPETVAAYVAQCATRLKTGSLRRRLSAIAEAHKARGLDSPSAAGLVRNTLKGIKRTHGTAVRQKAPTLTGDIREMVRVAGEDLIGKRDRALVLLGFASAFRRSELVSLDVGDLEFGRDGLTVTLRRSKTDQEGQAGKSASHTARTRIPAPLPRFRRGCKRRRSAAAQCCVP